MQATRASTDHARVAEAVRRLQQAGWPAKSIHQLQPSSTRRLPLLRLAPVVEPRLVVAIGEDDSSEPASFAYSSEADYFIHWGDRSLSLGQSARWQEAPGDSPGVFGDADDRWTLDDVFDLTRPERLLGGEAAQVSAVGKRHQKLAERLGDDLATLRRHLAEVGWQNRGEEWDENLLRFFHQLLFVRIVEDHGEGEANATVADIVQGQSSDVIPATLELLERYRRRLNSELFAPTGVPIDRLSPDAVRGLLESLVTPWRELNLDFSLSRSDLAGRLYQEYLKRTPAIEEPGTGRTPRLIPVAHERNRLDESAAYYTPVALARLLTRGALGSWLDEHRPKQPDQVRVLDPAAGSGSFLMSAYREIADYLESAKGTSLRPAEREAILRESIFGADIDPKAIGITQVQLLEVAELRGTRLPTLDENLFVGDSLLSPPDPERGGSEDSDGVPWQEILDRVGRFDVALMNPPFGSQLRLSQRIADDKRAALRERFGEIRAWGSDLAYLFVALALRLLKDDGSLGLVAPRSILDGKGSQATREHLLGAIAPRRITDLRGLHAFAGAHSYVALLELTRHDGDLDLRDVADSTQDSDLALSRLASDGGGIRRSTVPASALEESDAVNWTPFWLRWQTQLSSEIGVRTTPLGQLEEVTIHQGTQSGAQERFTIVAEDWETDGPDHLKIDGLRIPVDYAPLVAWGSEIVPLVPPPVGERLLLPYENDKALTDNASVRKLLQQRGGLPAHPQPGAIEALRRPKAILRGLGREPAAFADQTGAWLCVKGTAGGLIVVPGVDDETPVGGIAALLSSSLYQWLLRGLGRPRRDESIEVLNLHLAALPWPELDADLWQTLSDSAGRITNAIETSDIAGAERTLDYRAQRAELDALVLDALQIGPKLRQVVEEELLRAT